MRILPLVSILALFAGCSGAGEALQFKAPQRFGTPKNVAGMMSMWVTPNNRELLMLMKFPVSGDLKTEMSHGSFKNATIMKREDIKICGNQAATYVEMTKPQTRQRIDTVITVLGSSSYVALYGYPEGTAPDKQAEAAIHDLCAK